MHPFAYEAPTTIAEAVAALLRYDRARCLAGGTDILVQARAGRYELDALVDVKRIPELTTLRLDDDGLFIGAAVPCHRIYEDDAIRTAYPGIVDAASLIGGIQIQSRATLGGNLCNAAPSADGVCPLIVHTGGTLIDGPGGERAVFLDRFCTAPGETVLRRGELLVGVHLLLPPPGFGAAYQRFIPRNEMDIAVAGVASAVTLAGDGAVTAARIALAAVGPTPLVASEAAASLVGKPPTPEAIAEAARLAAAAARPIDDMRGTAEYRRELVAVLTRRTLAKAVERAQARLKTEDYRPKSEDQGRQAEKSFSLQPMPLQPSKHHVHTTINGQPVEFLVAPYQSLLETLREIVGLTGTKEGCNDGNCGACTVRFDGRIVDSCLVLGVEAEGKEIETIEGMATPRGLHPLQEAFLANAALQCGICTPGFLVAAKALLDREPEPSEERIRLWLAGNLCRCTGYDKIIRAVQQAAGETADR